MTTKPTILLIPGAWHTTKAMTALQSQLESAGYKVRGIDLPSVGADPPLEDFSPDVELIQSNIEELIDAEEDVLVFMHSYGSVPAGEAVKGLDKTSRRKDGKRGGVSHLFYCAAFPLPQKTSLLDGLGGNPLPWMKVSSDSKTVTPEDPRSVFFADCPTALADEVIADLKPHSYKTMSSKTTWQPYRDIPSTYLFCEKDAALPFEVQKSMVEGPGMKGVKWETETVAGGHSPFLAVPEKVARAVRRAAGETV